jgi:hypothetical protein
MVWRVRRISAALFKMYLRRLIHRRRRLQIGVRRALALALTLAWPWPEP